MRKISTQITVDTLTFAPVCQILLDDKFSGVSYTLELMQDAIAGSYGQTTDSFKAMVRGMANPDVTDEEFDAIFKFAIGPK